MQLVMIETNGNQRHIFSAPRLRDSIGASSQLVRLKEWTEDALRKTGVVDAWREGRPKHGGRPGATGAHPYSGRLGSAGAHPLDGLDTLWVSRSSGKVIFMVDEAEQAKAVIGRVTRTALTEAPGVDVSGVHIDMGGRTHVDEALLKEIHTRAAQYGLRRPPADARFPQMPFLARAKDSVLPASPTLERLYSCPDEAKDDKGTPLSLPARIKRYQAFYARKGLIALACKENHDLDGFREEIARDPTKLVTMLETAFSGGASAATTGGGTEGSPSNGDSSARDQDGANGNRSDNGKSAGAEPGAGGQHLLNAVEERFQDVPTASCQAAGGASALSKVAVIHIDGNGVGAVMQHLGTAMSRVSADDFLEAVGCEPNDDDALRRFVLAVNTRLEQAVTKAFADAWQDVALWAKADADSSDLDFTVVPVVPVILGGDDVTVLTSGDYALPFAAAYLEHYEANTEGDPLLRHLGREEGTGPMTAAAGVAVVRRNFPFHIAYDLAERLVGRAKELGKAHSPVQSTLTHHVLFDSAVLDPAGILRAYSSFTTRPFLLGSHSGAPDRASQEQHQSWRAVCERVRKFKGLTSEEPAAGAARFPRTRAARIRKLRSDAAQAGLAGQDGVSGSLAQKAEKEWKAVEEDVPRSAVEGIGGPRALFDLMELSDLLPGSYLDSQCPADGSEPETPQEAQE